MMLPVSTLELAILPGRGLGDHKQDVDRLGAPVTARLSPAWRNRETYNLFEMFLFGETKRDGKNILEEKF